MSNMVFRIENAKVIEFMKHSEHFQEIKRNGSKARIEVKLYEFPFCGIKHPKISICAEKYELFLQEVRILPKLPLMFSQEHEKLPGLFMHLPSQNPRPLRRKHSLTSN
jgi:hypothetical protein